MARSYSSDQEEDIQEEYSDGTVSSVEEEPARSAASQLNFVPLGQLAVVEAKFHSSSLAGDIKRRDFRTIGTGRTDKRQGDDGDDDDDDDGRNANPIRKRQSKHSPMEVSSKKPMSRKRQVVELSGYKARDPRFDPLCGQFSQNEFDQKYSFVDDYRRSEIRVLKSELAKKKSPKARASTNEEELEEKQRELNQLITKMKSQDESKANKDKLQTIKRKWRKEESEKVKQGKKPYFLKRSELKKMELIEAYKGLKERGMDSKLDKIIERRRQKNASKDHRAIPYSRRGEQQ